MKKVAMAETKSMHAQIIAFYTWSKKNGSLTELLSTTLLSPSYLNADWKISTNQYLIVMSHDSDTVQV